MINCKKRERKLENHNKNHCCSMEEFAVDPPSDFPAFGSLKAVWFRAIYCHRLCSITTTWVEEICLAKICVNINQSKVECCILVKHTSTKDMRWIVCNNCSSRNKIKPICYAFRFQRVRLLICVRVCQISIEAQNFFYFWYILLDGKIKLKFGKIVIGILVRSLAKKEECKGLF